MATAADGIAALDLVTQREINPELILTDYNLPNGMNGLELAAALRAKFHREIPVVILTGDISTSTLRDIAFRDCVQLNKPVKLPELIQAVQRLLPQSAARSDAPYSVDAAHNSEPPVIFIVDDDASVRESIRAVSSGGMGGSSRIMRRAKLFLKAIVRGEKPAFWWMRTSRQ